MIPIKSFKEKPALSSIFSKDTNDREICAYRFANVEFTGFNMFYPNVLIAEGDDLYLPMLERTMSLKSGTVYETLGMTWSKPDHLPSNAFTDPVFFFVYNTDNYYHFVYDTLPYLITYFKLKEETPAMKLLMQYPNPQKATVYPFVKEFLDILGVSTSDIVFINSSTLYSDVLVSTSYTHDMDSNAPPRAEIYDFYKDIASRVPVGSSFPKKIYVSRRSWLHNDYSNIGTNYTLRRKLSNEDALVEYLEKHGFKEVFTEKLSTVEKIQMFLGATHVVGAIGGGVANVVFSPPHTQLVVLVSPCFLEINARFRFCLDKVDVFYNTDTANTEPGLFKKYMRIKHKNLGVIGEIETVSDTNLLISYTDGSNTGWNSENTYQKMYIPVEDAIALDNGLNSEWVLNDIPSAVMNFDEVSPYPSLQSHTPVPA
jgi:hypothetical protein